MLSFCGDAFEHSAVLREKYKAFLREDRQDDVFASLECDVGMNRSAVHFGGELIHIRNFLLASDRRDASDYLVKCVNCYMGTEQRFSRMRISESYLRALSESSYVHLNEGIYQLARFRALFLDMLVLHASAVVYRDEVILFSGISGAGKSTQARLWLENTDAWVLNYDKPIVKLDGERVLVSGSPWGGKEDLAINEVRPAKALFFVHQAKENRVVRLSAAQAYARAHLNYFVYPISKDMENRYHEAILQLVKKVPVYDLYCTDTSEAVQAVRRALYPEEE